MSKQIEDEVQYYYDSHPTEEDEMGETADHAILVNYLMAVLDWLFHGQLYAIYENLNFYQTPNKHERPIAPDIAVIQGVAFRRVKSWRVGIYGPAPQVVFEIGSEETWAKDLGEKVWKYARMGVEEYYAYDPNDPMLSLSRRKGQRLFGWQRDALTGLLEPLSLNDQGQLWSPRLDSYLIADEQHLRLLDSRGEPRLTREQAEAEARKMEQLRAEAERQRAEREARRAQAEHQRAEAERQRAEVEARKAQAYAERLRSLGIDPDQIL
ncbi:MAG TPA: Uma2 family endonuclease [Ktedonobacteraceae bacterium]|jgi:Uma2 family endonuclease|nr:Uma2 family endonuclease [Ktedonobacteraceae bacterium]